MPKSHDADVMAFYDAGRQLVKSGKKEPVSPSTVACLLHHVIIWKLACVALELLI